MQPTRIIGSFTLPLQAPHRPQFRYLWEAIAKLRLLMFVHPEGTPDPWLQSHSMWNSVGLPIEEAKFIASLIYEGILEELPELRIVMAHGGGYLPHYYGRLDRNVTAHPNSAVNSSRRPSEYLRRLYYDTCLYEPAMLEALVARVGADRIVMGSDYPVGDPDPVGFVQRCPSLTGAEIAAVLGGTVANLLGLTARSDGFGVAPAPGSSATPWAPDGR